MGRGGRAGGGEGEAWLLHLSGLGVASQREGTVHANQNHVQRLSYHPYRLWNEGIKALVCLLKAALALYWEAGHGGY